MGFEDDDLESLQRSYTSRNLNESFPWITFQYVIGLPTCHVATFKRFTHFGCFSFCESYRCDTRLNPRIIYMFLCQQFFDSQKETGRACTYKEVTNIVRVIGFVLCQGHHQTLFILFTSQRSTKSFVNTTKPLDDVICAYNFKGNIPTNKDIVI